MKNTFLFLSFCFIMLQAKSQVMHPEKQLQEMGIVLGELKAPAANYVKAVQI
jgi:hypothetical protein